MFESQIENIVAPSEVKLHRNTIDLRGKKFGNLTVKTISFRDGKRQPKWECHCDCGNILHLNQTQLSQKRVSICQECFTKGSASTLAQESEAITGIKLKGVKPLPTKKFLHECFEYDDSTGILKWKERPRFHFQSEGVWKMWLAHYTGDVAGKPASRRGNKPHAVMVKISIGANNLVFVAHRIIGKMMDIEVPEGMQIDHKDRNPWNNRLDNLRVATNAQNGANQEKRKCKKGGLKGAHKNKSGRYQSVISYGGKQHHLGMFDTEQEAHKAYCKKAREIHGEFFHPATQIQHAQESDHQE